VATASTFVSDEWGSRSLQRDDAVVLLLLLLTGLAGGTALVDLLLLQASRELEEEDSNMSDR
jgi:hypothetical protein